MSKKAFITGASSGIGQSLAKELAARGYDLVLTARSLDKLESIQQTIIQEHPDTQVAVFELDVTDYDRIPEVLNKAAKVLDSLDIVFVNAGIAGGGKLGAGRFAEHKKIIDTNINGAMATIEAAVNYFRKQGRGHIAAVSSVAAYRGLPGVGAYCASKAGLSVLMESLRAELHGTNIQTTLLHPGYIDTPLNQDLASRPFLIDVEKGASIIADMLEKGTRRSTVPRWPWNILAPVLKMLPTSAIAKMGDSASTH